MTWARLAFKLQPSSIGLAAFVCLALAGVALWLTADMRSALEACGTPDEPTACQVIYAFQDTHGQAVMMTQMGIGLAMYGIPLVLGVPILTREIEHRTAKLAWSLAGSRLKWFAWRVLPVLAVTVALVGAMAFAAQQLAQAYFPHDVIGFNLYGSHGFPLITRAVLTFAVAVLLGAVIGRLLPALLIGIVVAAGITNGTEAVLPSWVEPAELTQEESPFTGGFPLITDLQFRAPTGSLMDEVEVQELYEAVYAEHGEGADPALLPREVYFGVAADRYPEVLVRESAAIGGATLLAGVLAAIVVRRRRPE
jgi:hypothetical protein